MTKKELDVLSARLAFHLRGELLLLQAAKGAAFKVQDADGYRQTCALYSGQKDGLHRAQLCIERALAEMTPTGGAK